ncbi:MAG: ribosomal protein S18-alanine N-acetyltransferase [Clostridia bacterium]|nr:ribosomal protein S18-alanine N-acetyltransferase [Clostridia bacterium]
MKVIFVCTGNTCRSPMAEGYLKSLNLKGVTVTSRGLCPGGDTVSEQSAVSMKKIGIDIKNHISKQINPFDLEADLFFCMTSSHAAALKSIGIDEDKIYLPETEIPDPYMKGQAEYDFCRDMIIKAINEALFCGVFTPFNISFAKQSDIKDIAYIEKECFSDPWSEKAIEESMNAATSFFIAKKKEKTVGYVGLSIVADEAYITNIAVLKDFRENSVATILLLRAIEEAKKKCAFISLEVRTSNEKAINLYNKLLFTKEGQRKGFYDNPKEDAIIMTRRF